MSVFLNAVVEAFKQISDLLSIFYIHDARLKK